MTTTAIAHPERGHDGASTPTWAAYTYTATDPVDGTTCTVHTSPTWTIPAEHGNATVTIHHDLDGTDPYLYLNAQGPISPHNARRYAALLLRVADQAATADITRIRKQGNAGPLMRHIAEAAHRRHSPTNRIPD